MADVTHFNSDDLIHLINFVRQRPWLYDFNRLDYKDAVKKIQAWKELARSLNTTEDVVKTKWQSLRDQYRRNFKRYFPKGSSSRDVTKRKWRFFDMMSFLEPIFEIGKSNGNTEESQILETFNVIECNSVIEENDDELSFGLDNAASDSTSPDNPPTIISDCASRIPTSFPELIETTDNARRKRKSSSPHDWEMELFKIMRSHEIETPPKRSDEYHYCMSLVSRMEALPLRKRGAVRLKIEEAFLKVEEFSFSEKQRNEEQMINSTRIKEELITP